MKIFFIFFCSFLIFDEFFGPEIFCNGFVLRQKRQTTVESTVQIQATRQRGTTQSGSGMGGGFEITSSKPGTMSSFPMIRGTSKGECYDQFGGIRGNNEQWIENNWKFQCNNGTRKVIACISSRRANFQEIPINSTVTVNGFWHRCSENNTFYRYEEEPSCLINGKELKVGDTFRQGPFEMRCQSWGYDIVGCYYMDDSGNSKKLNVGQTVETKMYKHYCENDTSSPGRVKYYNEATGCMRDGKMYKAGETWTGRGFKYECKESGRSEVVACITSDGDELAIDTSDVKNGVERRCFRRGGLRVSYEEQAVTMAGPSSPSASIDSEGNSQTSAAGSNTCVRDGVTHQVGDTWQNRGFKYECKENGYVDVVACIAYDGTEIPLGSVIVDQGWERRCLRRGNVLELVEQHAGSNASGPARPASSSSQTVGTQIMTGNGASNGSPSNTVSSANQDGSPSVSQPSSSASNGVSAGSPAASAPASGGATNWVTNCVVDGKRYNAGDVFVSQNFKMKCSESGLDVLACVLPDGTEINVGETKTGADGVERSCVKEGNQVHYRERTGGVSTGGSSTVDSGSMGSSSASNSKCMMSGKTYDDGEEWIENKFKFTCESGRARVKACLADDGTEIKLGTTDTSKPGVSRRCYQIGNSIQYREEPVIGNANGTSTVFTTFLK